MKGKLIKICICILVFLMAFSSLCQADEKKVNTGDTKGYTPEKIEEIRKDATDLERAISTFLITMGDYAERYISQVFQEEMTIDKIVYNKVALLNANMFETNTNAASSDVATIVRRLVNQWYSYLKKLAIVVMLVALVGAGVKILINTPEKKVAAKDILKRVVLGFVLVFFFPYVMKYTIELNEVLVRYIAGDSYENPVQISTAITQKSDLRPEDIEFRSPKYVSTQKEELEPGSVDATQLYLSRADEYQESVDVMRLMRACAGVTLKLVFVALWYILLAQTYILAIIYVKRFLMIAFLIAVYPIVVMGYVIEGLVREGKGAFNIWCKNYFANVLSQSFHALMYGIIGKIIVNQIQTQVISPETTQPLNIILLIVCTSFLFSGEKIINRFWKASTSTAGDRKSLKEMFGAPKRIIGSLRGK